MADERAPWKNGSADLQDRRPLDAIQLGKLDIEILGAAGERHRLIYTVTTGRTVSVAGVQRVHHLHPFDDLAERGEAVVQAGVVLGIDEHVGRPAVGSGPSEGHPASCVRLDDGIVGQELILPDPVHVGIVVDAPSRREALQHTVESDPVVPPTFYEIVEAVGPEGGPVTVYLDDEDPGRGLEAGLEDVRSRFVELAGKKKRVPKPRILGFGLVTAPAAGRQEAQAEKRKDGSGCLPTSPERVLVSQIDLLTYP